MIGVSIKPGDLLLTKSLQLVVIDVDHDDGRLSGRRISDGQAVELRTADVLRVFLGSALAPVEET